MTDYLRTRTDADGNVFGITNTGLAIRVESSEAPTESVETLYTTPSGMETNDALKSVTPKEEATGMTDIKEEAYEAAIEQELEAAVPAAITPVPDAINAGDADESMPVSVVESLLSERDQQIAALAARLDARDAKEEATKVATVDALRESLVARYRVSEESLAAYSTVEQLEGVKGLLESTRSNGLTIAESEAKEEETNTFLAQRTEAMNWHASRYFLGPEDAIKGGIGGHLEGAVS